MKISTKGRYALQIMIYLGKEYKNNRYVTIKEISKTENISQKYLEKIMLLFKDKDYFISQRGSEGGYKLAYPPEHFNIKDILEIAEGRIELTSCVNRDFNCTKRNKCSSGKLWNELNDLISNYLSNKTLEDLIKEG